MLMKHPVYVYMYSTTWYLYILVDYSYNFFQRARNYATLKKNVCKEKNFLPQTDCRPSFGVQILSKSLHLKTRLAKFVVEICSGYSSRKFIFGAFDFQGRIRKIRVFRGQANVKHEVFGAKGRGAAKMAG